MSILPFYFNALCILTPLFTAFLIISYFLRLQKSSLSPSDPVWEHSVRGWAYLMLFWFLIFTTLHIVTILGFILCIIVLVHNYRLDTPKRSIAYTLASENIALFGLLLFIQTMLSPYLIYKGGIFNFSLELSTVFILYSLAVSCVCILQPKLFTIYPSWKESFYRGWYYTLFAWILAFYDVEILLLSAFILSWIGTLMLQMYSTNRQPIGCRMARENVAFITFFWLLRSFLYQPFIVPTGSLEPTIYPGDFVLVNQYAYGLRFPVFGWKIYDIGTPKRGDIVVFRFPPQPNTLYVKRVIGIPGDHIIYNQDTLTINGTVVETRYLTEDKTAESHHNVDRYREELPGASHDIFTSKQDTHRHGYWEWHVPEGEYLMLGDNRQASNDSRFWGYVPDRLIVGKLEYILLSVDKRDLGNIQIRSGRFIKNAYAPD